MRFTFLLAIPVLLLSHAGCGGVEVATGGAGGSSPATTSTGSNEPTTGTSGGIQCGSGTPCGPTEYCDYPDNLCGQGANGVCTPRPQDCPKNLDPTCACDGSVHSTACEANAGGVDQNDGGCGGGATPAGMIPCGAHYCAANMFYCEAVFNDVGGIPSKFGCKSLPTGCDPATTDCTCFPPTTPCVGICKMVLGGGVGGFELDCPGG